MVSIRPCLAQEIKRSIQCAWVILFCVLSGLSMPTLMADAEKALENWMSTQSSLRTWKADFTQTRTFPTLSKPLVSTGKVYYKEPGLFCWIMGDPPRTMAWRTAEGVTLYYPRLKRAEVYPLNSNASSMWKDILSMLDAGFAGGREELEQRFEVVELEKQGEGFRMTMKPRDHGARRLLSLLVMEFIQDIPGPTATEFIFADRTRMRNDFRNTVINPELDEVQWKPDLPSDVLIQNPLSK